MNTRTRTVTVPVRDQDADRRLHPRLENCADRTVPPPPGALSGWEHQELDAADRNLYRALDDLLSSAARLLTTLEDPNPERRWQALDANHIAMLTSRAATAAHAAARISALSDAAVHRDTLARKAATAS